MTKKTSKNKLLTTEEELKRLIKEELILVFSQWILIQSEELTKLKPLDENDAIKNLAQNGYMLKRGQMGGTMMMAIAKDEVIISSKIIPTAQFAKDVIAQYEDKIIKDTLEAMTKK